MQRIYVKNEKFDPIYKTTNKKFAFKSRTAPLLLISSSLIIFLSQVVAPLVFFKTQKQASSIIENGTVMGRLAGFYEFEFSELRNSKQQPKTYYQDTVIPADQYEYSPRGEGILGSKQTNVPAYFYITIPKLKIEDAVIETGAAHLNPVNALGHYPETKLPGENGNSFIFGHSVLPWFFNPKNYKTIFSKLGDLETGDLFYITYNNKKYTYKVDSKIELLPKDVDPLADVKPKYLNESTVVLMTCSPPGTKLKRLLVNAILID